MKFRLVVFFASAALAACSSFGTTTTARPVEALPSADAVPASVAFESLPLDTPTGECIGGPETKLAIVTVASGPEFSALFPTGGRTPELEAIAAQLLVVIYKDGWPGPFLFRPMLLESTEPRPRVRQPDTWDVCVHRTDGKSIEGLPFIVYGNVPQAGSPLR